MAHRLTELITEFAHGSLSLPSSLGVQAGIKRLEHIIVVVVGGEMREEIKPCGEQDLLEPFEAWIPFAVLDGTDGAARRTGSLGQLHLGEPRELTGLHYQCGREGRHSPTDAGIRLVVVGQVTEIGMDASHICSVPDPRREIPGA